MMRMRLKRFFEAIISLILAPAGVVCDYMDILTGQTAQQSTQILKRFLLGSLFVVILLRLVAASVWPVPLTVDEAQYLVWSRELQAGYYSKPPFIAWAIFIASHVCPLPSAPGQTLYLEGCVRWLQPAAVGLAAVFTYLTTRALFRSAIVAAWSAVIFALAPLAAFYSQAATTDAWLLLWWSAALWAFVRAIEAFECQRSNNSLTHRMSSNAWIWWAACGAFSGLGLLTKYSMGVFAVSALIVLAQRRLLLTSGPWLCATLALLVFSPNLFWNAQWGWPTFSHHADITIHQSHALSLSGLWEFLASQWLAFGPIVFGLFLWATFKQHPTAAYPSASLSLLLAFAWPMLLVVMAQSISSRAHANWSSPALIAMSILVAAWCLKGANAPPGKQQQGSIRLALWGTLTLNLGFSALLLSAPWWVEGAGLKGQRSGDPFVRLTGYKETALLVGQLSPLPIIASDDRKLLASLSAYLPEARVYAFNPEGLKDNHWQLQRDLSALQIGAEELPILLVQVRPIGDSPFHPRLNHFFERVEPIATRNPVLESSLYTIRLEGKASHGVAAHWVWPTPMPTHTTNKGQ